MKKLKVLFMGTPEFAVHILDEILQADYEVVGVVTAPDRPAGRGQKLKASAVKAFSEKKGLKVLQPPNLKAESFQKELEHLNPSIAVVVAFRMLPKMVWDFPEYGTFNLHASLLPDYRGAAPIQWAIINGEKKTGVTTFFLDENIDTGTIIANREVPILPTDNAGSLHDKLMIKGGQLVVQTLRLIEEGKVVPTPQPSTPQAKKAPKLNNNNTRINWGAPANVIENLIKGLNPYPGAWCMFKNGKKEKRCKIYAAEIEHGEHQHSIGKIFVSKEGFKVAVKDGFLVIKEMQLPGKRKMPMVELLNGLHLKENAEMR